MKIILRKLRFEIKNQDVALWKNFKDATQKETLHYISSAEFTIAVLMFLSLIFK